METINYRFVYHRIFDIFTYENMILQPMKIRHRNKTDQNNASYTWWLLFSPYARKMKLWKSFRLLHGFCCYANGISHSFATPTREISCSTLEINSILFSHIHVLFSINYMDSGILLKTKTLVELIFHYIRDTVRIFPYVTLRSDITNYENFPPFSL